LFLSPKVVLTLIYGDATSYIKELDASVDAFYLDGFSPKKNEDLWNPSLFASFRRLAAKGASFSTYSSAGLVRRGMSYAGFDVEVKKGFGRKKEMLVGVFRDETQAQPKVFNNVTIIGGGIAGCSLALRASELGLRTRLIDGGPGVMGQGSSNPFPLVRPTVSLDFGPRGQFSWYAYFYAMRFYRKLSQYQSIGWQEISAIQLAKREGELAKMRDALGALDLSEDCLSLLMTPR
jgi:tRNA 5-methylaminomethyl-2-thiouridine biosynthesis bifunctional protein